MSDSAALFPHELLSQSNAQRITFFQQKMIQHPHLTAAYEQLMRALQYPDKDTLVLVFGPSRVGKSTLVTRVGDALLKASHAAMSQNPGMIPVIALEAACQNTGGFDWKDHHKRLLQAAEEPPTLIPLKRDPDSLTIKQDQRGRNLVRHGGTNSDLRLAVEACFRHRQVRTLIVDEAHHLVLNTSGRRQQMQMEVVKSLTSLTHTTQVLVGTYDLLALRELSAQLSCRTTEIHLPRYRLSESEEQRAFRIIVNTLQKWLPLAERPDLVSDWEFCYERSAGCIGILKKWLTSALVEVLAAEKETLTKRILEKAAPTKHDIAAIAREIMQGEDKIFRAEMSDQEFRALLGLPDGGAATNGSPNRGPQQDGQPPKRRRRPGERNPTRDPVGITSHAE